MSLPNLALALRDAERRYQDALQDMNLARAAIKARMIEEGCRSFSAHGDTYTLDREDSLRVMATVQEGDRRHG